MMTTRHILATVALLTAAGFSQAQTQAQPMPTQMSPDAAGAAAQSNDPLVQKRQADADAKSEYKMEKKAAKKDYKNDKKAASNQLKSEKTASKMERDEKLKSDPIVRPTP